MGQKIDLTTQVQGILPEANGGAGPNSGLRFSDAEIPAGAINGANGTFTLAVIPNPAASLLLFVNRLLQVLGVDFTLVANVITIAPLATGSTIIAWYRYLSSPAAFLFRESLSLADSVTIDLRVSVLPSGEQDSMLMGDSIAIVMGPVYFAEPMVMLDSIRIVLLPLNIQPTDQLVLSDAMAFAMGKPKVLTDNLFNYVDGIIYMLAGTSADIYSTNDIMRMSEGPIVNLSFLDSFSESLSQSDSIIVQMR